MVVVVATLIKEEALTIDLLVIVALVVTLGAVIQHHSLYLQKNVDLSLGEVSIIFARFV